MAVKRSFVEFIHDEGYGEDLVRHINVALRGKDMIAHAAYNGATIDALTKALEIVELWMVVGKPGPFSDSAVLDIVKASLAKAPTTRPASAESIV